MDKMKFDPEFIRNRIRQLIDAKDVPDSVVSELAGMGKSFISDILSGKSLPAWESFFALCEVFEITPAQFFNIDDENPMATVAAIKELKRLLGDEFESFPQVLANITKQDLEAAVRVYEAIRSTNRKK